MWKSSAVSLWNECHDDDNKGVNGPIFLVWIYAVTKKDKMPKKEIRIDMKHKKNKKTSSPIWHHISNAIKTTSHKTAVSSV